MLSLQMLMSVPPATIFVMSMPVVLTLMEAIVASVYLGFLGMASHA